MASQTAVNLPTGPGEAVIMPPTPPLPRSSAWASPMTAEPDSTAKPSAVPEVAAQPPQQPVESKPQTPEKTAAATEPSKWRSPIASIWADWFSETPSWLASMLIHLVTLLVIAVLGYRAAKENVVPVITSGPVESGDLDPGDSGHDDLTTGTNPVEGGSELSSSLMLQGGLPTEVPLNPLGQTNELSPMHVDLSPFGQRTAPAEDMLKSIGGGMGNMGQGIGGRKGDAKTNLLKSGGGTPESEDAVARALKWLSIHQMPDGGWDFDLRDVPGCKGKCEDSGDASEARNAATALALLPFLGAGETHLQGQYKKTVQSGLYYLTTHAKNKGNDRVSFFEDSPGTMYSHGLTSIVLCEAYGMTKDRMLKPYAQGAVRYIEYAQDPSGGGWRYEERASGDTSVVGWQIMALKSAQMAGLETSSSTLLLANKFLDSVEDDDGAAYGYRAPTSTRPSTSSIGLLCRMYLGWRKQNPALKRGVAALDKLGPSIKPNADMYYNYYATQVMHHWGGNEWDRWNYRIREWLISQQSHKGHESGSWFMADTVNGNKARAGGRLYCTSMAAMILEVYYRYLPLYGSGATVDEFSN